MLQSQMNFKRIFHSFFRVHVLRCTCTYLKVLKKSVEQHDEAHLDVPLINYTCEAFPTSFSVSKARDYTSSIRLHFRTVYCITVLIIACLRATSVVRLSCVCGSPCVFIALSFWNQSWLESFLTKLSCFLQHSIIPRITTLGTCWAWNFLYAG